MLRRLLHLHHGLFNNILRRGLAFKSSLMALVALELGINLTSSPTYSPRVQGLVEKSIDGIKKTIRTIARTNPKADINAVLVMAESAHNHHPSRGSEKSPYEILFGTQPRTMIGLPLSQAHLSQKSLLVEEQRELNRQMHEVLRAEYTELFIKGHEEIMKDYKFKPGDIVWRKYPKGIHNGKITGPHYVISKDGKNTYTITKDAEDDSYNSVKSRVLENQLRKTKYP